jgi:hypothetical protein
MSAINGASIEIEALRTGQSAVAGCVSDDARTAKNFLAIV